ncbi:MAG: hypothetical protein OEQ74_08260, partial [Gammaproteobacteria bacterium]|nr:hypothetical protein [Gammaproteobacteria bacterium]
MRSFWFKKFACKWHAWPSLRPCPFAIATLFLSLAPGVAWSACEAPYYHTDRRPGWCAGIGGLADADFDVPGAANELVMVERGFSGALLERRHGKQHFLLGLDYAYRSYEADEEIGANLDLHTFTVAPLWSVRGDKRDWLLR